MALFAVYQMSSFKKLFILCTSICLSNPPPPNFCMTKNFLLGLVFIKQHEGVWVGGVGFFVLHVCDTNYGILFRMTALLH